MGDRYLCEGHQLSTLKHDPVKEKERKNVYIYERIYSYIYKHIYVYI